MKKVLIIGCTAADIAGFVQRLPKSDEEIVAEKTVLRTGGSAWCMANAFRLLNMPYDVVSPVGTGVYGEAVRKAAVEKNIPLQEAGGIHGCTYTLIDQNGNTASMAVPGCEYQFHVPEHCDPDDYSAVLCSGSQFEGQPQILAGFLSAFRDRIIFQPGGNTVLLNAEIMGRLYDLHPVLHLSAEEAGYLCEGRAESLREAAEYLHGKTNSPVIIFLNDLRAVCYDGSELSVTDADSEMLVDRSGAAEGHCAAYLIARNAGMGIEKALEFAGAYALTAAVTEDTVPDEREKTRLRQNLTDMILSTDIRKAVR